MRIRVFVETVGGTNSKSYYDERTLQYKGSIAVARAYPYPYGFVLGTKTSDGGAVDCYIITKRPLQSGEIAHCDAIALMEQFEGEEDDHKVLAALHDEEVEITSEVEAALRDFIRAVFGDTRRLHIGRVRGREATARFIKLHCYCD